MLPFLIKSTICLVVFYGFYHFFLRKQKVLFFNRFYLISSLVLSILVPFIVIPVKSNFRLNNSIEEFYLLSAHVASVNSSAQITSSKIHSQDTLLILFSAVALILLFRFALNLSKILQKIRLSKKIRNNKTTIVLTQESTLPYSFFKYIFVNQKDFENGKIEPELLLHEEAHCDQLHSIDILFIEILNIFLWYNPIIWLFRRELLLNHEYSADNRVLIESDTDYYKNLLLNVLLRNNSNYLVSNFRFSLTQNRINMMTKEGPSNNAIFRKICGIIIFLLLGFSLTFSKENVFISNSALSNAEKPELFPIRKGDYAKIPRAFGEKDINPVSKDEIVHYGIDIKAKFGTEVIATAGGKVIKAEFEEKGYGNYILIDHGDGYQSLYGHLKDRNVMDGDIVIKGQTIGHVGSSGLSTEPHLHFEIIFKGDRINPLELFK